MKHPLDIIKSGAPYDTESALFTAIHGAVAAVLPGVHLAQLQPRTPRARYSLLDAYLFYVAQVIRARVINYRCRAGTTRRLFSFSELWAAFDADLSQESEVWWYTRLNASALQLCAHIDAFLDSCTSMRQGEVFLDSALPALRVYDLPSGAAHMTTHLPWLCDRFGWEHSVQELDGVLSVCISDRAILARLGAALIAAGQGAVGVAPTAAVAYDSLIDSLLALSGPSTNVMDFSFRATKDFYTRNDVPLTSVSATYPGEGELPPTTELSIFQALFSFLTPAAPLMLGSLITIPKE